MVKLCVCNTKMLVKKRTVKIVFLMVQCPLAQSITQMHTLFLGIRSGSVSTNACNTIYPTYMLRVWQVPVLLCMKCEISVVASNQLAPMAALFHQQYSLNMNSLMPIDMFRQHTHNNIKHACSLPYSPTRNDPPQPYARIHTHPPIHNHTDTRT